MPLSGFSWIPAPLPFIPHSSTKPKAPSTSSSIGDEFNLTKNITTVLVARIFYSQEKLREKELIFLSMLFAIHTLNITPVQYMSLGAGALISVEGSDHLGGREESVVSNHH